MSLRRALSSLVVLFGVAGCAAISGVDQYQKGECAGGCDGAAADGSGLDATVDARVDAPTGDATIDGGGDSGADSGGGDSGDSGGDAAIDGDADSGGGDGGCGPTNTLQNCTACGATCDQTNASQAACNGSTCLYTCKQGFSNCNNAAPDLDGCECATPSCCANKCATSHSNGVGQTFYDCVAQGTYDPTQATEACTAWTGNQNLCAPFGCTGGGSNKVVCANFNNQCTCWNYSGSNIGKVLLSQGATCYCPGANDPGWN